MKIKILSLILFIPVVALSEVDVISRPLNPVLNPTDPTIVTVHVTNTSRDPIPVPGGFIDEDGFITPKTSFTVGWELRKFVDVFPKSTDVGCAINAGRFSLNEAAANNTPVSDRELASAHSIAYKLKIDWQKLAVRPEGFASKPFDICILTFHFDGYDIEIPSVMLHSSHIEKSSRQVDPAVNTSDELGEVHGTGPFEMPLGLVPTVCWITIERKDDHSAVFFSNGKTVNCEQISEEIGYTVELVKSQGMETFVVCLDIKGHVELSDVERVRKILSQHGFDHFAYCPSPKYDASILATIGEPTDIEHALFLHGRPRTSRLKNSNPPGHTRRAVRQE